jgi:DNA topoisomerase-1
MHNTGLALAAAQDPHAAARAARLRHVADDIPGIARRRAASGFDYLDPDGRLIGDFPTLSRIKSLVIPPAWTAVWICPFPNGHIQATGRDARGRKQYRYHPRWRETRDETKFDRMLVFSRALPRVRARVDKDLRRRGLPRERVLAAIVRLLEVTLFRIGNSEYSKTNNSFGLTTLRNRHAAVSGDTIRLAFRGKSGVWNESRVSDRRLASIVKSCRDLPGYELFQYLDEEGQRHTVGSAEVNDYLREISGEEITAKDFRTWAGTFLAALALRQLVQNTGDARAASLVRAVEQVAGHLGNTVAVCRKCYIHPAIFDGYLDGTLIRTLEERLRRVQSRYAARMSAEEAAVAAFLRLRLKAARLPGRSAGASGSFRPERTLNEPRMGGKDGGGNRSGGRQSQSAADIGPAL